MLMELIDLNGIMDHASQWRPLQSMTIKDGLFYYFFFCKGTIMSVTSGFYTSRARYATRTIVYMHICM
jgi:hypothetical protein